MAPGKLDSLDADSLKPLVQQLLMRIDDLLAQNKALLARIAELEAKLGQPPKTPDNSSLPPSRGQKANAEPPATKPPRKGRPGVARQLAENPDATRRFYAERCRCGAVLDAAGQDLAKEYDHIDIPPIRPVTTRIALFRATCPCCQARVTASAPADMPEGTPFGPGIASIVTYLHGCQMVGYKRLAEVCQGLFGLTISQGAIANMLARVGEAIAAPADRIAAGGARQRGHRQRRDECAREGQDLVAVDVRLRHGRLFRHGREPRQERADGVPCRREAEDVAVGPAARAVQARRGAPVLPRASDPQCAICHRPRRHDLRPGFKALLKDACAVGRRRPDLADATITAHRRRLERELERLLALKPTDAEGRKLRDAVALDCRGKLFVFLKRRDVEPTNNESERALRPSVIFRKVTNGFRSEWGAKAYAALCSIVETGRRNGRSALTAIRDALATPAAEPVSA